MRSHDYVVRNTFIEIPTVSIGFGYMEEPRKRSASCPPAFRAERHGQDNPAVTSEDTKAPDDRHGNVTVEPKVQKNTHLGAQALI